MLKQRVLFAAKLAVTIILIVWLARRVEWGAVSAQLLSARWDLIAAATLIHLLAYVTMNFRWWRLLVLVVPGVPWRATFGSFWLGLFANNFLPSGIGGDVARVLRLRGKALPADSLVASSLVDRIFGLLGVLSMGLAALTIDGLPVEPSTQTFFVVVLVVMLTGVLVLFSSPFGRLVEHLAKSRPESGLLGFLLRTVRDMRVYRGHLFLLISALVLSVILQAMVIVSYWLIAKALGVNVGLSVFFVVVPILFLILTIPVAFGGLGLRESSLVTLLGWYGVPAEPALAIGLVYLILLLVQTMPGGLVLLKRPQAIQGRP